MTVSSVGEEGQAVCQWFYRGDLAEHRFATAALQKLTVNERGTVVSETSEG